MQANGAVPDIPYQRVLPIELGTANVRRNTRQGHSELHLLPECNRPKLYPIAIVAGGPSLRIKLSELGKFRTIMVCASAHDFLVEHGIIPRYAVVMDPIGGVNLNYLSFRQETCTYLVASHVNPDVMEHFAGYPVALWHAMGEARFGKVPQIMGGCTALLRATFIALHLGYTKHHYFGVDSCFEGNDSHAYPVNEPLAEFAKVRVANEGRVFTTTSAWALQARQFFDGITASRGAFHSTLHGDGLIAEMVRCGNPAFRQWVDLA